MNKQSIEKNSADSIFISAFVASLIFAKDLTVEEQILLGNYLQIIGLNLTSYATFYSIFESQNNNEN